MTTLKDIATREVGALIKREVGGGNTNYPTVNLSALSSTGSQADWRTRLTVGPATQHLLTGAVMNPLIATGGIVFPYTPSFGLNHTAAYGGNSLAHTNYDHPSFEMHQVGEVFITGRFTANSRPDADYVRAVIHFLRTMTKMFFGQDSNPVAGTPPPILRFNSHGNYIFTNIPVIISNFTINMEDQTDYILTTDSTTRIPTACTINVTVKPVYSREAVAKRLSLTDFANGNLLGSNASGGFL